MSIAAYRDFSPRRASVPSVTRAPARAQEGQEGIVRRIFAAIGRWQQRSTDRAVRRFIAAHGGRLTDDVERQLSRRFGSYGSSLDGPWTGLNGG